jgi:hypothetical protein
MQQDAEYNNNKEEKRVRIIEDDKEQKIEIACNKVKKEEDRMKVAKENGENK